MKGILRHERSGLTGRVFMLSAVTFFLSSLTCTLGSVVDGFIMGQAASLLNLAAISLVGPLNFVTSIIYLVLGMGCQPLCARELSDGNRDNARRIYSMTVIAGVGAATVFTVLVLVFNVSAARFLGADPGKEVFAPCRDYLIGIIIGLPASTAFSLLSVGVNLEGARKTTFISTMVITVTNILMDLLCVRYFDASPLSMGITTSLSYVFGAAVLILYFLRKKEVLMKPCWCRIQPRILGQILFRGIPVGVSRFACFWRGRLVNRFLAVSVSVVGLAAYNTQVQVNYLTNAAFMGIAQTLALMAVIYFAEQDHRLLWRTVLIGLTLEIALSLFLRVLGRSELLQTVCRIYLGGNTESYDIAGVALILFIRALVGQALTVLFANYLASTGRTFLSNTVYILCDMVFLPTLLRTYQRTILANAGASDFTRIAATFAALYRAQMMMLVAIPLIILFTGLATNRRYRSILWNALLIAAYTAGFVAYGRSQGLNVLIRERELNIMMVSAILLLAANLWIHRKQISPKCFLLMLPADFGVPPEQELTGSPGTAEEVAGFARQAYEFCLQQNAGKRNAYIISLAIEELGNNILRHGFAKGQRGAVIEMRLIRKDRQLILRIRDNGILFDPTEYLAGPRDVLQPEKGFGIRMIREMSTDLAYASTMKMNNLTLFLDLPGEKAPA